MFISEKYITGTLFKVIKASKIHIAPIIYNKTFILTQHRVILQEKKWIINGNKTPSPKNKEIVHNYKIWVLVS